MSTNNTSYSCDTIPEPQHLAFRQRLRSVSPSGLQDLSIHATDDDPPPSAAFDVPTRDEILAHLPSTQPMILVPLDSPPPPAHMHNHSASDSRGSASSPSTANLNTSGRDRKLCVRHLRMADEGTFSRLQQSLDALPLPDRQAVSGIWSTFSSSSHPRRATILQGILTMCCFSQLSYLTEQLHSLIRLDPFSVLPKEVCLKILGYLDAFSLCRASQVNRAWSVLANDDVVWRDICRQHIGHTCAKCGWGLPVLDNKRRPIDSTTHKRVSHSPKREFDPGLIPLRPAKRQRSETHLEIPVSTPELYSTPSTCFPTPSPPTAGAAAVCSTRPWKSVYCERLTIERNWRRGRCTVTTLTGHSDGVMCMQLSDNLAHPAFPVLITGSYDRTVRVWNLDTGKEVCVLQGHGRAVRALQFDEAKLITGSMDRTLKVWNWRTGACIRTLEGHSEGIVSLNFDSNVLASGSVDTTIKVWNFRNGECFTLRGHHDWVNSLQLWSPSSGEGGMTARASANAASMGSSGGGGSSGQVPIDPGKMLFSASDDGTIKLWDLTMRACIRTFVGHVGQVQSIKLTMAECDREREGVPAEEVTMSALKPSFPAPPSPLPSPPLQREFEFSSNLDNNTTITGNSTPNATQPPPKAIIISGSLDNTIKVWDIDRGKSTDTMFGHIEGVWAIASDRLRIVSGSHDRTIKVWNREDGKNIATLVGHRAAVTCLSLGDDKIVSGSDDGDIRIWSFAP